MIKKTLLKNKLTKFLYFFLPILLLTACSEDNTVANNNETQGDNSIIEMFSDNFGESLQASFFGKIVDTDNNPIENVEVKISGIAVLTDQNGIFSITNANVYKKFAFIKASKEGFVHGSKTLVPLNDEVNYIEIVLLEVNTTETINSDEISEILLNNGSKVILNGDYVNHNGSNYAGSIDVSMHYLAPSNDETYKVMPGSLLGSLENNEAVILENYGMIAVNLFSTDGESLNLAEGTTATIELPIDPSQMSFAPESIPLWYFNDELGYWIKEGEAIKIGDKYVGEVSHFSWWTYCIYDDGVNVCINVKNTNGDEIPNQYFTILKQENGAFTNTGFTNMNGSYCDFVPYFDPLVFRTVYTNCDGSETIFEQEIGSFTTNDTEIDITLNIIEFVSSTVTASILDCDSDMPIENGYFYFEYNEEAYNYPIGDSTFEFNFIFCVEQPQITLIAYNLDTNTETEAIEINLSSGVTDLGTLNTCDNSSGSGENNNIFQGDVTLTSQEEVNNFGSLAYTKIAGSLFLNDQEGDLTNLNSLQSLIVVEGDLEIKFNGVLTNLFGLQNLERVEGTLHIRQNSSLDNIEGLQSLQVIGNDFVFHNNDVSTNLNGLENITQILGNLDVSGNAQLQNLNGLVGLASISGSFYLGSSLNYGTLSDENSLLDDITGLSNLLQINGIFRFVGQPVLEDFSGLSALETVNGDFIISFHGISPYEVNGFENLSSVNGMLSIYSTKVTDFSGFNNLQTVEQIEINGDFSDSNQLIGVSGFNSCNNNNVEIRTFNNLTSITGFQSIQTSDRVNISQNNSLESITGFNSLQNVTTTLQVSTNPLLSNISGFSNVNSVNTILLTGSTVLSNLSAFSNLTEINGYGIISGMNALVDLSGLESLTIVQGRLQIEYNDNLINLAGLNNLTTVNSYLDINNCDSLINLNGLEGLTHIEDYLSVYSNQNIQSLDGVENLLNCDGLRIGVFYNISSFADRPNPNLSDFCALQNLLINGDTSGSYDIIIDNNAYWPTVPGIQSGDCSL